MEKRAGPRNQPERTTNAVGVGRGNSRLGPAPETTRPGRADRTHPIRSNVRRPVPRVQSNPRFSRHRGRISVFCNRWRLPKLVSIRACTVAWVPEELGENRQPLMAFNGLCEQSSETGEPLIQRVTGPASARFIARTLVCFSPHISPGIHSGVSIARDSRGTASAVLSRAGRRKPLKRFVRIQWRRVPRNEFRG